MTRYNLKPGLRKKELTQLHTMNTCTPMEASKLSQEQRMGVSKLSQEQRMRALLLLLFLERETNGRYQRTSLCHVSMVRRNWPTSQNRMQLCRQFQQSRRSSLPRWQQTKGEKSADMTDVSQISVPYEYVLWVCPAKARH